MPAGRAAGDYAKLFRDAAILMKAKKVEKAARGPPVEPAAGEITVPESAIEHVAAGLGVPSDIDERLEKAISERR